MTGNSMLFVNEPLLITAELVCTAGSGKCITVQTKHAITNMDRVTFPALFAEQHHWFLPS